jgi:hypothetical protein
MALENSVYLVFQKYYKFTIPTDVYFGEAILIPSLCKLLELKFTATSYEAFHGKFQNLS